jgi:hypothetical protein
MHTQLGHSYVLRRRQRQRRLCRRRRRSTPGSSHGGREENARETAMPNSCQLNLLRSYSRWLIRYISFGISHRLGKITSLWRFLRRLHAAFPGPRLRDVETYTEMIHFFYTNRPEIIHGLLHDSTHLAKGDKTGFQKKRQQQIFYQTG